MTNSDFIKKVAADNKLTQKDVKMVLDMIETELKTRLQNGETVKVLDITFSVYEAKERNGYNPIKGEKAVIPGGKRLRMKPSTNLKTIVK